jgi:hypothetical protein
MVKLEGVRIADSPPAALFTLIVGPSEEGREVGKIKQGLAETEVARRQFWADLLNEARTRTSLHANISPGINHWVGAGAGKRGLVLNYLIFKNDAGVDLYVDCGKNADAENKAIFDNLEKSRDRIDSAFGSKLVWQRLDGKRACRIRANLPGGGLADRERWPEIRTALIECMIRFEQAFRPIIDKL